MAEYQQPDPSLSDEEWDEEWAKKYLKDCKDITKPTDRKSNIINRLE